MSHGSRAKALTSHCFEDIRERMGKDTSTSRFDVTTGDKTWDAKNRTKHTQFLWPLSYFMQFSCIFAFFHGSRKRKSLRCLFCKKKQWCKYVTYQVVKTIAFYSTCPTMLRGLFVPTVLPLHERQHHVTHKWCKFLTTKSSSRRHIFPFCCCSCCCYSVLFSLQFNSRTHC